MYCYLNLKKIEKCPIISESPLYKHRIAYNEYIK